MLWSQFSAILPIFSEKIGVFLKTNVMVTFSAKLPFMRVEKRRFFRQIFLWFFKKIQNIGPWLDI
jgi:hypothetical protein